MWKISYSYFFHLAPNTGVRFVNFYNSAVGPGEGDYLYIAQALRMQ